MLETWPCGHDRAADNIAKCGKGRTRCRSCSLVKGRAYHYTKREPKPHDPLAYRQRYLPIQLEATERKLTHLRREAVRIGLGHLVEGRV